MNAYELADELDALFTKADWEEIPSVVGMLRQQADRIAELEKIFSKPVAWMGITAHKLQRVSIEKLDENDTPLYAHPVKQLSDEEKNLIKEAIGSYVCTIKMEIDQERQTFKGYLHCSNIPSLESELKDAEKALAIIKEITE